MVEVKRKKGETFESFLRRFSKRMMQSGTILQFKKVRYYKRPVSKGLRKKSALVRKKRAELREYMRKIGRLEEEDATRKKRY